MPTHPKTIEPAPSAVETQSRFVTLAGNPNSGKTSLFNALTGAHQLVGNYPGITVERKEGCRRHRGSRPVGMMGGGREMSRGSRFKRPFIVGVLCLLVGTAAVGAAQECQVSGVVRNPSNQAIAGAVVLVEQLGVTEKTDGDGRYCFNDLEAGTYHLVVTADGYQLQHSHPIAVDGIQVTVDLVLQPTFRAETVVTATRTERRLSEVPVRTEIVRREAIERTEARTLADAIEFTTGVRVESNCQNCNFSQIRLLGLGGAYTQILVDSQPIISSLAQVYGIEQIPERMIDRIEVVKGGGSALYGAGSVGGVVNVIPRLPVRSGGSLEFRPESISGEKASSYSGALDWVAPDRNMFVSGFGQADNLNPVDVDGDGFTEVAWRTLMSAGVRAGFFLFDGDARLSLDYAHINEDRRGGNNLDLPEFMADVAESIDSTLNIASATWLHTVSSSFDYRLTLSYADTERDTYYGSGMDPNAYGSTENPLLVFDSQVNRRFGPHYLSAGVQYNRDKLTDTQPAYDRYIAETYTNLGLFLQDDWILGRGWELVYGARLDDFSEIDGTIVSPRVAVKFAVRPNLTSRLSISSGFRGPQVFDEDLHITQVGGEGQVIRNDPNLKEESSLSTSLGLEWTPLLWGGVGLLETNLFNTEIDDLFLVIEDDDPTTPEAEFTRVNYGSAFVRGLEFNLGWAFSDTLQLQLGYVWQRSERNTADPDFGSVTFFRTPDQYGVASIIWKVPWDLELWIGAKYTGTMEVPHYAGYIPEDRLETTDQFLTLDLRVAREFPLLSEPTTSFRVAIGGRNITDEFQQDLDQGPDRDSGYVYGPRFPRSWYVSFELAF